MSFDFKSKVEQSFKDQKFMAYINARLVKVEKGICYIELPYNENLTQQNGFIHAGIISTLADNAAGYAAFSVMEKDSAILTVEFKINLMSPAIGDHFLAKSEVLKHGKNLTICRSEVFGIKNGVEKICAAAQSTLMQLRD